ncbi:MAG: DUF3782 domain-containing protein [Candidatus Aminicenantes bacterium]|jgi:hypothetical protein
MNINTDNQTIKRLIKQELPGLMKKDKKIREWILQLTKEQLTEKTNELETKTESKFDRLLEELRRDREEQSRKWEEQNKKWEEQNKKWEENQKEIRKLYDGLEKYWKDSNRKLNTTVGALGARWGVRSEGSFRNALKGFWGQVFYFR